MQEKCKSKVGKMQIFSGRGAGNRQQGGGKGDKK
jgi:hypothetical protein